jgi:hypothetical protein
MLVDPHGANLALSKQRRERFARPSYMRWVLALALAACARDVRVSYPLAVPADAGGTLVVWLTQPADDVTVAVNGVLVAADAHTQRVVIDRVPLGTADVIVAANGQDKSFHTWIGTDHVTTVPLGVPAAGSGFFATLAGTLLGIVVCSLLHT